MASPRRLHAYQRRGVDWMVRRETATTGIKGGILADDMGLGKTVQMLEVIRRSPRRGPNLICVPLSVVDQWAEEIQLFEFKYALVTSNDVSTNNLNVDELKTMDIILCPHSAFTSTPFNCVFEHPLVQRFGFNRIVVDEAHDRGLAHALKNPNSKLAACLTEARAAVRWVLTGTPVTRDVRWIVIYLNGNRRAWPTFGEALDMVPDLVLRRTENDEGESALMLAVRDDKHAIVTKLKDRGDIDVNHRNNRGETALMIAASLGNSSLHELLRYPGIDANLVDEDGDSALMRAAAEGYVKELLDHRDNFREPLEVNIQNNEGETAMILAAKKGYAWDVKELLGLPGIDVDIEDKGGKTAMVWALEKGHIKVVRLLAQRISSGLDSNDMVVERRVKDFGKYIGREYDVTFIKDGRTFKAHKKALIESSDVFNNIFAENNSTEVPVYGRGEAFEAVRLFCYTDEVDIPRELAWDLLDSANFYGLEGLKDLCAKVIELTIENVVDVYEEATRFNATELNTRATSFFLENCAKMVERLGAIEVEKNLHDMKDHLTAALKRTSTPATDPAKLIDIPWR